MSPPHNSTLVDRHLAQLHERHRSLEEGCVASYYASGRGYYEPGDAGAERDQFAIAFATRSEDVHVAGDCDVPFALQSLAKVFVYGLALEDHGREHVGVEPSGDAFNSIDFDERQQRPHNPMVNAGALVTADLVRGANIEWRDPRGSVRCL